MTDVLICDDRRTVREGLTRAVSAVPGVQRIECVSSRRDLVERYVRHPADVVLVGVERRPADTVAVTRRLVTAQPPAAVFVFGTPEDADSVAVAIAEGACGFLRWDPARPELEPPLLDAVPRGASAASAADEPAVPLTERELQVLRGMSAGKSNGQIGRELYLSEDTVKTHARGLYRKFAVSDRAAAVALAFRLGVLA